MYIPCAFMLVVFTIGALLYSIICFQLFSKLPIYAVLLSFFKTYFQVAMNFPQFSKDLRSYITFFLFILLYLEK